MKMILKELLVCLLMGLVIPGAMLHMGKKLPAEQAVEETASPMAEPLGGNPEIPIMQEDGNIRNMDMEEYLVGVVLAEMPASFEGEALKAQSVAARTYAGKAHLTGGKHGNGAVCTDSSCCQAYMTPEAYLKNGGTQLGIEKVRGAVSATCGEVLTHEGELIEATYFSCSGGSTEDAQAVWGQAFPYLIAVESPGEEKAEVYRDQVIVPKDKAEMLLGLTLPENPAQWIGVIKRTPGNGVATAEIGGRIFKGTELRTLLGLKSTAMTLAADDRGLIVETRGWGHRVGMSQYGADAMAVTGKSYKEILAHYYPGTLLTQYIPPEGDRINPEFSEGSEKPVA